MSRKKAVAKKRRLKMLQWAAGTFDFVGAAASALVIIVVFALLVNMLTWLRQDVVQSFAGIRNSLGEAIVQPIDPTK